MERTGGVKSTQRAQGCSLIRQEDDKEEERQGILLMHYFDRVQYTSISSRYSILTILSILSTS